MAALVEQNHDDNGIIWPVNVAPYKVGLVVIKASDPVQSELAEKIYAELSEAGIEPLYDDRDERAGVKFKDMELIGIPMRITVGKLAGENKVEFRKRTDSENTVMSVEEAIATVKELCR